MLAILDSKAQAQFQSEDGVHKLLNLIKQEESMKYVGVGMLGNNRILELLLFVTRVCLISFLLISCFIFSPLLTP
jgi:hypothetical protein